MAHASLPVFSHPDFPQAFSAALDLFVERIAARPALGTCDYSSPESSWGACDSLPCTAQATVHHLGLEREFCARHFREVSRG